MRLITTIGKVWAIRLGIYRMCLPYFKKSEKQERGASAYHGTGGPLYVADLRFVNPLTRAFYPPPDELGMPSNPDFNARSVKMAPGYIKSRRKMASVTARPTLI